MSGMKEEGSGEREDNIGREFNRGGRGREDGGGCGLRGNEGSKANFNYFVE